MAATATPDTLPARCPNYLPPRTAAALVCRARVGLDALAPTISAFFDHTPRWTIERATAHGDARLLQRVIDDHHRDESVRIADAHYIAHVVRKALAFAVRHDNDIELLECLVHAAPALQSRVSATLGAQEAAALGKVHVLQWLKDHCPNVAWEVQVAHRAASAGHVCVLEWLRREVPEYRGMMFWGAIERAVSSGHLAAVEWLHADEEALSRVIPRALTNPVFEKAISHGRLPIVQFLHEHGYKSLGPPADFTMQVPVDVPFVQWLAANGYARFCRHTLALAADAGDTAVVQWLLANVQDISEFAFNHAAGLAAASGHSELLELLHDKCSAYSYGNVLEGAARGGHLALVQWAMENMRPRMFLDSRVYMESAAVRAAAVHGHLELAAWVHAHHSCLELAHYHLDTVAKSGRLASVQWIAAHTTEPTRVSLAVRVAIENGYLDILAWLYKCHGPESALAEWYAMDVAAEHGHLHILQWLHDHGSTRCTNKAVELAAANGHLAVVEWLLVHRADGHTSEAMRKAAANGHFEILLLLHTHGGDEGGIGSVMSDAFEHNQVDIFSWLCEQHPDVLASDAMAQFMESEAQYIAMLHRGEYAW